tara:strand:+ start:40 stop:210 length:171 start_codon:yes stop_codon:yes gene_type:complete
MFISSKSKEEKVKTSTVINKKPEDKFAMLLEKITLLEHRLDSMNDIVGKLRNRAGV